VENIKIYFDTCCYNRPFDDSTEESVKNEIAAKQEIQNLVKNKKIELTVSYVLYEELEKIQVEFKRNLIFSYIQKNSTEYILPENKEAIIEKARTIELTGVKKYDALHTACAILARCDCLITVDKRLLKYETDEIKLMNPVDFINEWRLQNEL
jgi:predicted nucleic acid-binding protein